MTAYRYRWLTGQTPPEGLGINYDYRPLRKIGSFDDIRHGNKHYIFDNKGSGHRTNVTTFAEWSSVIQDRLLISEWGTALDKPVLPTHLQQGESVETVLRIADDPTEAEEAGLQMRVTLRLILADMTGGSHILNVSLNDTALPEQRLKGQSHAHLDLAVPNSSVKCGDNTLELSLASEDPNVLSEIRIDDVEVFISYG